MRFFYLQRGFTYVLNAVVDSEAISEHLWFHLISTRAKDIPEGELEVVKAKPSREVTATFA